MNVDELHAWTRKEATLSQYSTEYTTDVLLSLYNKTMDEVLTPMMAAQRSGYWVHTFTRTLGVSNPVVRLPPRSCPAIEQVDISDDGVCWVALPEVLEAEAQDWANEYGNRPHPMGYVVRSSYLQLIPAASAANIQIRIKVVVRPSKMVQVQSAGLITAIDTTTNVLTVNAVPTSMPGSIPQSGTRVWDVIEPRSNFELSLCDAVGDVLDSTHVQIAAGYSLARIEVGDYLRVAQQCEWPQLPIEFHSVVGSISALPILRQRNLFEQMSTVSDSASSALSKLREHLGPRVRVQQHKPMQHNWR